MAWEDREWASSGGNEDDYKAAVLAARLLLRTFAEQGVTDALDRPRVVVS